jgi:hypothetical protein
VRHRDDRAALRARARFAVADRAVKRATRTSLLVVVKATQTLWLVR